MLLYYLKETFDSLFKSKLGSLLIVITTAIAIIFATFSVGLIVFSNSINNKLKENIRISLFVDNSLPDSNYSSIVSELKENDYIESHSFVSKDEALKIMKQKTGKDFSTVLEANPLPASYVVKLRTDSVTTQTIEPIIASLENTSGITDVVYDYNLTLKILNYINSSKKIIYGVSIFLVFLSIYLVYSNNRLLLTSRLNQYNTMKLVGAKLRTIKIPIILNGVIMGFFASGICLGSYYFIISFVDKIYNIGFIELDKNYLIAMVIVLGICLGFLGSFLATLNVSLKINKIK